MPAPVYIGRRESGLPDPSRSPLLHPALSNSLSRSFGLNSPFSLSAMSSSLTALSSSPGFSNMSMSLGRSFEERPKLEAQFFRNFSCCGLDLQDLHGLLEHFEECHVAFEEDNGMDGGMEIEMEMDDGGSEGTISGPPSPRMQQHHQHHHQQQLGGGGVGGAPRSVYELKKSALSSFETAGTVGNLSTTDSSPNSPATTTVQLDPGMELDMEMGDGLPGVSTATSSVGGVASVAPVSTLGFQHPPMSAFDSPLGSQGTGSSKKKFSTAMNPLGASGRGMGMGSLMGLDSISAARSASGYTTPDSSIPGTPIMEDTVGGGVDGLFSTPGGSQAGVGLAPSLLFPGTSSSSGSPGDGSGHEGANGVSGVMMMNGNGSDGVGSAMGQTPLSALPSALHPLGTGVQISPSGRPYTPPSEKPFKCSVSGCDKSYKQQNGLKYHRLHGHCNQNNVGKEGVEDRGEGKPYVCHVTSCGKRYKNMNGLRYHYQHSGAHGALGLQMLAQSCHPPPQFPPGHKRSQTGSASTSRAGSPAPSLGGESSASRQSSPGSGIGAQFPRGLGGLSLN